MRLLLDTHVVLWQLSGARTLGERASEAIAAAAELAFSVVDTAIILKTVLFPEPLGPRSAVMFPSGASKETPVTASKSPNLFSRFST